MFPATVEAPDTTDVPGVVRFLVLYGSHAHGTATATSDKDWRGVYQLPTDHFLGLETPKSTWERKADDFVMWELGHFCRLLLGGNPNVVGMLWAPPDLVTTLAWPVQQLVIARRRFITWRMVAAYRGWVHRELRAAESLTPKRASHLLRLQWELRGAVEDGDIPVVLPDEKRHVVIAVKTGIIPVHEAVAMVIPEIEETDRAIDRWTSAPDPTDYVRSLLVEARRRDLGLS